MRDGESNTSQLKTNQTSVVKPVTGGMAELAENPSPSHGNDVILTAVLLGISKERAAEALKTIKRERGTGSPNR